MDIDMDMDLDIDMDIDMDMGNMQDGKVRVCKIGERRWGMWQSGNVMR